MTVPTKIASSGEIMESVIVKGDLAKLDPGERAAYYMKLCESMGLNPLTRPMEYITLNGKLTLYAKRDCADQLRKINGISIQIVSQEQTDGLLTVHVRAKDHTGREDEDLGVVNFPDTLKGDARANAILKAVTKAKRRVTLSISGLGFLDETEIEDIPALAKRPPKPAPNPMLELPPHNPDTGEVIENTVPQTSGPRVTAADAPAATEVAPQPQAPAAGATIDERLAQIDEALAAAAKEGMQALKDEWAGIHPADQKRLKAALDKRHKPSAESVDRERNAQLEEQS